MRQAGFLYRSNSAATIATRGRAPDHCRGTNTGVDRRVMCNAVASNVARQGFDSDKESRFVTNQNSALMSFRIWTGDHSLICLM